jgi:hypothetical protein
MQRVRGKNEELARLRDRQQRAQRFLVAILNEILGILSFEAGSRVVGSSEQRVKNARLLRI